MRFERTPQEAQTGRGVRVLEADPELAGGLEGVRLARATDRLTARPVAARSGTLSDRALGIAGPRGLGLLVLDGVLARELLLSDNISVELLGTGDVVKPLPPDDQARLLHSQARWTVVEPTRFAVLGSRFAVEMSAYRR
jgi:hypothetical protein